MGEERGLKDREPSLVRENMCRKGLARKLDCNRVWPARCGCGWGGKQRNTLSKREGVRYTHIEAGWACWGGSRIGAKQKSSLEGTGTRHGKGKKVQKI